MFRWVALFNYDGDGDVEIYFLNGAPLPGPAWNRPDETPGTETMELEVHGRHRAAGVGDTGYGAGVPRRR